MLIVGDGIRENVEELVEFLAPSPHLQFALGLVELQVFSLDDEHDSRLVVPQIVMRTKELTRTVIEVKGDGEGDKINSDSKSEQKTESESPRRTTTSEKVFFEDLEANAGPGIAEFARTIIDDFTTEFTELQWSDTSFSIRFVDDINPDANLPILNIKKSGKFNLGKSARKFQLLQLSPDISKDYAKRMAELTGTKTSPKNHICLRRILTWQR